MNDFKIEVCSYSVRSAINAEKGGAYRVELCSGFREGGTTPSHGEIETARKNISIKLNVMIRPRGGDFIYSPVEIETMLRDIEAARKLGADGIAAGALMPDGTVDLTAMKKIIEASAPLPVTFHRAFDCVRAPFEALEAIIELGAARILTSGLKKNAPEGKELLAGLVKQSGGRIIIMPGGGINPLNIGELARFTGANEFHLSGKSIIKSGMNYFNEEIDFYSYETIPGGGFVETDAAKIKSAVEMLEKI